MGTAPRPGSSSPPSSPPRTRPQRRTIWRSPVDGQQTLPPGELKNRISNAVVQLMHDYTGRGPTRARTYLDDDLVTILLRDTMTVAETNLADAGQENFVMELRQKFQQSMKR